MHSFIIKQNHTSGRYIAKKAIQNYLFLKNKEKIKLADIAIFREGVKKPFCKIKNRRVNLDFSLSHRDDLTVTSVSQDKLVGIDIERIRNFDNNFLQNFLNEEELKLSRKKDFLPTLFWSFKESYLKALGRGLVYHPKNIEISLDLKGKNNKLKLYDKNVKIQCNMDWIMFNKKYIITKVEI